MAVTLNASTSTGLVQSADTSGEINLQSNGTTVLGVTSTGTSVTGTQSVSGNLSFNSGYGSSAVAYGCRAWVNFDGTGTVSIRASGNVTSITDNGTGDYTVNFTNAMPDANYAQVLIHSPSYGAAFPTPAFNSNTSTLTEVAPTTTAARFACAISLATYFDPKYVNFAVFR
jgi:hypothetical protein